MNIEPKVTGTTVRTSNNTAVKSTITSQNNATIRKPTQQQITNDERMFFGRPTTIGQGQYHNRTGLMPSNRQQYTIGSQQQRRSISWFQ